MTKSELVRRLTENHPHLELRDLEIIVTRVFDEIAAALSRGDRVELRGFGAFSVRRLKAKMGRNPRTGEIINLSERRYPSFRPGKPMRELLNA